jgi:hypothetical protein
MSIGERSVLCLFNWDLSASMVDDGSYFNWLEGTRVLEAAIDILPIGVSHVGTDESNRESHRLNPAAAMAALQEAKSSRALLAGNFVERDIIPFAISLTRVGILPIILFDVCGTLDPLLKWRALATAVDEGVTVSTVQQTLRMLLGETTNRDLRAKITAVIQANLGEHAVELSAA